MTKILTPISTDHSLVLSSKNTIRGKGFWKLNSSLTKDLSYTIEIKKIIRKFSNKNESPSNRQLKWELLKYDVKRFTIKYTKNVAKEKRQ